MIMKPSLRKFALTAHVTASVGWVGALAVFFAHALAGWISADVQLVRAVSIAMAITAWFVILPLSLASLLTGIIQALGTAWGLLRHYWVAFKLLLTAVATVVLLLKLEPISYLADATANAAVPGPELAGLRMSLLAHAAGGLLVLLAAAVLAIYKPVGMTRYGIRRQREEGSAMAAATPALAAAAPRWVKASGMALLVLLVLVGLMVAGGGHGPGAHT